MNQADLDNLLAQLRSTQERPPRQADPTGPTSDSSFLVQGQEDTLRVADRPIKKDLSRLTFTESLPILRSIALEEPNTLKTLKAIKNDQDQFQAKLLKERNEWSELGKRKGINEPGMVARMKLFDRSLLKRWSKYQLAQQAKLVELGIPCFQVGLDDEKALIKMERVMNVLVDMLDDHQESEERLR